MRASPSSLPSLRVQFLGCPRAVQDAALHRPYVPPVQPPNLILPFPFVGSSTLLALRFAGTLADIKQKITVADGPSGGSTYVPFADGAGLHIFGDNNEVEDEGNSVQAKVAIHEYIHILQQAMLAGDITNLTGTPVPLKVRGCDRTEGRDGWMDGWAPFPLSLPRLPRPTLKVADDIFAVCPATPRESSIFLYGDYIHSL